MAAVVHLTDSSSTETMRPLCGTFATGSRCTRLPQLVTCDRCSQLQAALILMGRF